MRPKESAQATPLSVVIPSEARDLHLAANCRSLASLGMTRISESGMNVWNGVVWLNAEFFNRDPRRVARALLGKLLIRKTARGILAGGGVGSRARLRHGNARGH